MTTPELAAQLAAEIQTAQPDWTVNVHYIPETLAEDIAKLIIIMPRAERLERIGRAAIQRTIQIDIAIQDRIDPNDQTQIDALIATTSTLAKTLLTTAIDTANPMTVEIEPLFSIEHIRNAHIFTAVIQATYADANVGN